MAMNQMTGMGSMDRAAAERASRSWWLLLVNGIISIVAGIIILSIDWTLASLAVFIGVFLILRGVLQAVSPPHVGVSRSWNIATGIASALVGAGILLFPTFATLSLLALAIFIGAWLIVSGITAIVGSTANRESTPYWWLSLVGGIFAVALGIFALYRPILTLAVAVVVVGIWAIIVGTSEIALAFEVRRLPQMVEERARLEKERKVA